MRLQQGAPPSRIANDRDVNENHNDEKAMKIKRPQASETVRSIPIKDYRASIAHNIGTLRRSVAPQSQFEILVSEPEKCAYIPSRKRVSITDGTYRPHASQITASQAEVLDDARVKSYCRYCDVQHDSRDLYCATTDACKNVEDDRYLDKTDDQRSHDGSDMNEYFRRSTRRSGNSSGRRISSRRIATREHANNADAIVDTKDEQANAPRFVEGHVGQKISAYERNVRRSLRSVPDAATVATGYRSLLAARGHRTIGVPLVGMHNACGLPVVATWHDRELLDTLRVSRRIADTFYRCPRAIACGARRAKRRAPPQSECGTIHRTTRDVVDRGVRRATIKSTVGYSDAIDADGGGRARRRHRRASLTATTKVGSLSSRNSFKRTTRPRRYAIKASSLMDTFGRKSIKGVNTKRTTLYAKDDGEDAVQVLKSLCLNPLARTNPETDMMW